MVQKKIKPCWTANDVEGQENQRDNTIQKANILSFQVSLTKQKLKDLGRRTLSKKKLLISLFRSKSLFFFNRITIRIQYETHFEVYIMISQRVPTPVLLILVLLH